jgi:antitoxin component YwqK of YwqJK toxin-antitoxin module
MNLAKPLKSNALIEGNLMSKRYSSLANLLLLSSLMTSCQTSHPCDEIVCQTYVHRYGVPLEPQDWSSRGKHGQVMSLRKDGVTITQSYNAGIVDGECTYTFPHRELIQKKEQYVQGTLVEETLHYPSGMPQQRTIHGPSNQSITTWYENGAPQSQEEWNQGRMAKGEYYTLTNQVESSVEDGNGLRTRRNDQEEVEYVDNIQDGQMTQRTTYHKNGTPAVATQYKNGQMDGERRTYSVSGEPLTVETWTKNCQHGYTAEYEYGEKVADVPYVRGQKQGLERRYRDNGQVTVQEITWMKGKKQGPCYFYTGNTKHVDWYFADRRVNKQTYDMLVNQ